MSFTLLVLLVLCCLWPPALLAFRVGQRIYYFLKGHRHHGFGYRPRYALEEWLKQHGVASSTHAFKTRHDGVNIHYRCLGTGPKHVLLANGVGTDLHMWLMTFKQLHKQLPTIFDHITLVVLTYRGLFEDATHVHPLDKSASTVNITIDLCAQDVLELMEHAKIQQFYSILGWSTGAQVALSVCLRQPSASRGLFLLNPSTGYTLHTFPQAFMPLPHQVGAVISRGLHAFMNLVSKIIDEKPVVWETLRWVAMTTGFRCFLEGLSFFGGFPPEQAACFHEYMRDQFSNPRQTKHLLALICALDDPPPANGFSSITQDTVIVSGFPDFLCGVYHSRELEKQIPKSKHVCFSMASHFLLIEWPELLATDLILHLMKGVTNGYPTNGYLTNGYLAK